MKFFANFFFLVFFSTTVLAKGLNNAPTELLPPLEKAMDTPTVIQIVVQERCRGDVVYYHTPGITTGGVGGGVSAVAGASAGLVNAFSTSLVLGGGGVFGTTGQTFPVITSCLRKGGENE